MKAVLKLTEGGKEFKVANVSFGFNQMVDGSGRPTSEVLCDQIHLSIYPETIDPEGKTTVYDNSLYEWMVDSSKAYDGSLIYHQSENELEVLKVVTFTQAFCVSLSESMAAVSGERIMHNISITVGTFQMGAKENDGPKFTNMWMKGQ